MWQKVFRFVPKKQVIKHILVIGLGNGSIVRALHVAFPKSYVTIIESDTGLVRVAKEKQMITRPAQTCVVGDIATNAIAHLDHTFDLIILQSEGVKLDPLAIQNALEPDGFLFLTEPNTFPRFLDGFTAWRAWDFKPNAVALFKQKGQGHPNDPLPEGFIPPLQSPTYLQGIASRDAKYISRCGTEGCYGVRQTLGPYALEMYSAEREPTPGPFKGLRMIVWQPLTQKKRPKKWIPWPAPTQPALHGIGIIKREDYWLDWTKHAQRHRKKWLAQTDITLEKISFEEFRDGFNASGKIPHHRKSALTAVQRRMSYPDHGVIILGARDKITQRVVAALAVNDLFDIGVSVHLAAFIHPDFESTSVGTGLIDDWYRRCLKQNIRFPYFDILWSPGDPKAWQGYSQFKRQFHPYLIRTPKPFVRFTLS